MRWRPALWAGGALLAACSFYDKGPPEGASRRPERFRAIADSDLGLPRYSGARFDERLSLRGPAGTSLVYRSDDPPEAVAAYYRERLGLVPRRQSTGAGIRLLFVVEQDPRRGPTRGVSIEPVRGQLGQPSGARTHITLFARPAASDPPLPDPSPPDPSPPDPSPPSRGP